MEQKAIVVKRGDGKKSIDTNEIKMLTEAAGYSVVKTVVQKREEDSEYNIGSGKLHEVSLAANKHNADAIVFGNELGPYQKYNIGIYVSEDIVVYDKNTIVLQIFEKRATSKEAQLQLSLTKLRYELPRVQVKTKLAKKNEHPGFMGLGDYKKNEEEDIKQRISRIKKKINSYEKEREKRREKRREAGFDLVSIAGYTNAGKSMLFKRLAEETSINMNEKKHDDLPNTAESKEKWFTTLDTTVRKMENEKRKILLTDTVGFITSLPDWFVDSFKSTFSSIYNSDLVLIVADGTLPLDELHENIVKSKEFVYRNSKKSPQSITVVTKIDKISKQELEKKKNVLSEMNPNSVFVSAKTDKNIEQLKTKIDSSLPPLNEEEFVFKLNNENAMKNISWLHDNSYIKNKEYDGESVRIVVEADEATLKKVSELPSTTKIKK